MLPTHSNMLPVCINQYLILLPVSYAAAELSTVNVEVCGTLVSTEVFHLVLLGDYPLCGKVFPTYNCTWLEVS